ncbi:unnamed protein product [Nesidiocoris tenuis]|uniref:Uncharacterized protein n=1 Tax=Nesidiocoris tenuis TaxID=355587 RepID=A0A6H5G160_9HEMI|nr:unnamed protein product [Nesidiocoris tenuis]
MIAVALRTSTVRCFRPEHSEITLFFCFKYLPLKRLPRRLGSALGARRSGQSGFRNRQPAGPFEKFAGLHEHRVRRRRRLPVPRRCRHGTLRKRVLDFDEDRGTAQVQGLCRSLFSAEVSSSEVCVKKINLKKISKKINLKKINFSNKKKMIFQKKLIFQKNWFFQKKVVLHFL